jgi:3-keto-5-aminohexanoate cleavage enzyme
MKTHGVKPEIEAFDLSHIFQAVAMAKDGRIEGPLYVQFVMGVKNAMPVDREVFDFYVETLARLAPDAEWCGAGIGRDQSHAQRMVRRRRWPCPHRARGQPPPRPRRPSRRRTPPSCERTVEICEGTAARSPAPPRRGRILGLAA